MDVFTINAAYAGSRAGAVFLGHAVGTAYVEVDIAHLCCSTRAITRGHETPSSSLIRIAALNWNCRNEWNECACSSGEGSNNQREHLLKTRDRDSKEK